MLDIWPPHEGLINGPRRKAKDIEHCEKSLDLWKDADPGLPEVDDAKAGLAGFEWELKKSNM